FRWAWRAAAARRQSAQAASPMAGRIADVLIFRGILDELGLSRLELMMCTGGPLAAVDADMWRTLGVPFIEHVERSYARASSQSAPAPNASSNPLPRGGNAYA